MTRHGNDNPLWNEDLGYSNGYNPAPVIALVLGVLPNLPGFLEAAGFISSTLPVFETLYAYGFVGLAISAAGYALLLPCKGT